MFCREELNVYQKHQGKHAKAQDLKLPLEVMKTISLPHPTQPQNNSIHAGMDVNVHISTLSSSTHIYSYGHVIQCERLNMQKDNRQIMYNNRTLTHIRCQRSQTTVCTIVHKRSNSVNKCLLLCPSLQYQRKTKTKKQQQKNNQKKKPTKKNLLD